VIGPVVRGFHPGGNDAHEGIDIDATKGTPVRAAEEGKVIYSDNRIRGYGNMIIIRHKGRWATIYAHNEKNSVREGDFVRQGQEIARVGSTGRSTGSHLHFEVRYGRKPVDPLRFLPEVKAKGD
jgi:lipoprotein NlpD